HQRKRERAPGRRPPRRAGPRTGADRPGPRDPGRRGRARSAALHGSLTLAQVAPLRLELVAVDLPARVALARDLEGGVPAPPPGFPRGRGRAPERPERAGASVERRGAGRDRRSPGDHAAWPRRPRRTRAVAPRPCGRRPAPAFAGGLRRPRLARSASTRSTTFAGASAGASMRTVWPLAFWRAARA